MITRNLWGAVIGAILGHMIESGMHRRAADSISISDEFFRTTFEMMGHVAKSDGRVSEAEIDAARALMQELQLGPRDVSIAIERFLAGKSAAYDAELSVERLREACGQRHDLLRAFMELQLRAALAGNAMSPPARAILMRVAERLGMSGLEFAYMEAALRARQ
ncbi:MAG TPA: TerB family tellurite resistance protein, partial [Steroidobacteraceae bacterium]